MDCFAPIATLHEVLDHSEHVKRLASFLATSIKKKTLGNVIFAEAGLYSDDDERIICPSCHFMLESINNTLNLVDVCKYHLSKSPNCNVALKHFKALNCCKSVGQVKADLYRLAATFPNKTEISVNVHHNRKYCQHPSPSNETVQIPFVFTKSRHHDNSNEEEHFQDARGIEMSKPLTSGYSEASARVGEQPVKNGANDNFSKASKPTSDSQTPKRPISYYQQSVEARRSTFANWPADSPVEPDDLAEAGFVYGGRKDNARCVFCSGMLCEWEVGDVPKEEHDKHFPLCKKRWTSSDESRNPSSKLALEFDDGNISLRGGAASGAPYPQVGRNYVGNSLDVEEITKKIQSLQEANNILRERKLCKLCLDRDIDTVFLPCGHLVSCKECAPKISKCAICRTLIRGTVLAFIPDD